jgi:hypothetical protein
VGRVVLAMALGGGLAAFQMLPVLEVLGISNRQTRMEWDFRTAASLPPWHLLELFGPLSFGDPRGGYWPGPPYEWHGRLLFVGTVPLLAAASYRGWRWLSLYGRPRRGVRVRWLRPLWYPLVELLPATPTQNSQQALVLAGPLRWRPASRVERACNERSAQRSSLPLWSPFSARRWMSGSRPWSRSLAASLTAGA